MMVYSVAEEHSLGIYEEVGVVSAIPVAIVLFNDVLKYIAHVQIVSAVLVPVDVPAVLGGFAQMVDVLLLSERQVFPSRNPVSHDLDVGELVNEVSEVLIAVLRAFLPAGYHCRGRGQCQKHFRKCVHIWIMLFPPDAVLIPDQGQVLLQK